MDAMKRAAAAQALTLVEDGMRLGLGTGSTARHFVDLLGERVAAGLRIIGVPTSEATRAQAQGLNIPLADLGDLGLLDLTVDGADEIGPGLALIKGAGGAHLREKIVAAASKRMVVIADDSKVVDRLGRFALPLEVVRFGEGATMRHILAAYAGQGLAPSLTPRMAADGSRYLTDEGNVILDARLGEGRIDNPAALALALDAIPGLMEHGLFVGLCSAAYVASQTGVTRLDVRA